MNLYLYVTNDKYELPLAIADTPTELARMLGLKKNTIHELLSRERHGKSTCRVREIDMNMDGKCFSGEVLRKYRQNRGISTHKMSEIMGVAQSTIVNWEHGVSEPHAGQMFTLADFFEIESDEFFRR